MEEQAEGADWETEPHLYRWRSIGNAAIGPLFERYVDEVRQEIRRIIGSELPPMCDEEDLLNHVWQKLCEVSPSSLQFGDRGAFRAFLLRFTRNRTIDELLRLRTRSRNCGRSPEPLDTRAKREGRPLCASADVPTPSAFAVAREHLQMLRDRMESAQFEIWYAVEVEGRPQSELAARTGLTIDQVGRLYRKALKVRGRILGDDRR